MEQILGNYAFRHGARSHMEPRNGSVFYSSAPTAPSKNYYDDHWGHNYPGLGLPIRIANRKYYCC